MKKLTEKDIQFVHKYSCFRYDSYKFGKIKVSVRVDGYLSYRVAVAPPHHDMIALGSYSTPEHALRKAKRYIAAFLNAGLKGLEEQNDK